MADSNRGLIPYTDRDYDSLVKDFWELVPKLTDLWKPEADADPGLLRSILDEYLASIIGREDAHYLVYVHILPDNRVYVGMTGDNLYRRSGEDGKNYQDTKYNDFYNGVQEVGGWDKVAHYVLAQGLTYSIALQYEELFTRLFEDSGYIIFNRKYGVNGLKHTDSTKQKISQAGRGHKVSADTRHKISVANTGKERTAETIERQRNSVIQYYANPDNYNKHQKKCAEINRRRQCGKKLSEDTKQKISNALKGRKMSQEWLVNLSSAHIGQVPANAKPIIAKFPDGSEKEFISATDCSTYFGKHHDWARRICTSGGYTNFGVVLSYKEVS